MTETSYDFAEKYTRPGLAARVLLEGFFGALEDLIHAARPLSVLEVGCGEGFSTRRYRMALLPQATLRACDVELRLVDAARQRNPGIDIDAASIYQLPHADASFDLVIATEVLEHLEHPGQGLQELVRVSKRHVIVSVPREPLWRALNLARGKYLGGMGNTPGHIQHWSQRAFVGFVNGAARVTAVRAPLPWTVVLAEKAAERR